MLERETLQIRKLAQRQRAAPARVDHARAGGGHAAGELVRVLRREVVGFGGAEVVVGPSGGDLG